MRVRILSDRRCAIHGWQWAGEVHDLPREEALRLLAANQAEAIPGEAEEAIPDPGENTAKGRIRRK